MLDKYYDSYWQRRLNEKMEEPIPKGIPDFLKKYTSYGAILNQIEKCENLLDIGCGDGNVSVIYKQKAKNVYGVDISDAALKKAVQKDIIVAVHDLNELPLKFQNDFFDYIIITDVLEHTINPVELLKETKRILKPGGKAIITVPNFARLGNRFRMWFWGDPIDILHWSKYGDEIEHLHWFTLPKLKHLILKDAGFIEVKFVPTGLKNLSFILGIFRLFNLGGNLTLVAKK